MSTKPTSPRYNMGPVVVSTALQNEQQEQHTSLLTNTLQLTWRLLGNMPAINRNIHHEVSRLCRKPRGC
eukprot:8303603-Pyramimonas_sp.AAC.1